MRNADTAGAVIGFLVTAPATWFLMMRVQGRDMFGNGSALNAEQRARKEALKEAKRIIDGRGDSTPTEDPTAVMRLAEFILGGKPEPGAPR